MRFEGNPIAELPGERRGPRARGKDPLVYQTLAAFEYDRIQPPPVQLEILTRGRHSRPVFGPAAGIRTLPLLLR